MWVRVPETWNSKDSLTLNGPTCGLKIGVKIGFKIGFKVGFKMALNGVKCDVVRLIDNLLKWKSLHLVATHLQVEWACNH